MREQLGLFLPLWRLSLFAACATGIALALRSAASRDDIVPMLLIGSAGLASLGYEVYRRINRVTLSRDGVQVQVARRGISAGSFNAELIRAWSRNKQMRDLVRGVAMSVLVLLPGLAIAVAEQSTAGVLLAVFGVVSIAAIVYDTWAFSTIEAPGGWILKLRRSEADSLLAHRTSEPRSTQTGTFERYDPFGDGRHVIIRRGREMGFDYGLPLGSRDLFIEGQPFRLVRYRLLLSPPVDAGMRASVGLPLEQYQPEDEVLRLPDAEVSIRRLPNGFSDSEVDSILAAIQVRDHESTLAARRKDYQS